jgi:hypothetical protein
MNGRLLAQGAAVGFAAGFTVGSVGERNICIIYIS